MNINEKLLAIEIIFRDICSDWRKDHKLLERLEIAEKLVQDIINDSDCKDELKYQLSITANEIDMFKYDIEQGAYDGRVFCDIFPNGFEEMDKLHNLSYTYYDKSEEFKNIVDCILYPRYVFSDRK